MMKKVLGFRIGISISDGTSEVVSSGMNNDNNIMFTAVNSLIMIVASSL